MPASSPSASRGTGWVVAQFALIALIAASWLSPPHVHSIWLHRIGVALALAGLAIALWASRELGRSLTPFPRPRSGARLVTTGPFRLVRHPIYSGGLLVFTGVSLRFSWAALVLTGVLAVLWAFKTQVEERHLRARFPEYDEYGRRTSRLVPFVY